ncbi:conserved hypothetical protein [Escherichia coli]|nr:hypothetical protein [Citrobacter freundii]CTQ85824.1 conserved hypothetical protein [Escherichia coli]
MSFRSTERQTPNKPAFLGMIDDVEHAIKRKCPFLTYRLGTMSKIQSNRQSDG